MNIEINRDMLIEVIRSALKAPDLHSVDAMYQTFDEIASVWGADFTVAEAGDLDNPDPGMVSLELYRNEPNSIVYYLTPTPDGWMLEMNKPSSGQVSKVDLGTCKHNHEIADKLVTLVYNHD